MTRIKPESYLVVNSPQTITSCHLPLASSTISAGFPSPADDFTEDNLDLNEYLIKHPAATFFVRVSGTSMTGAGIQHKDLLIVDRAVEPYNNAIVVAILDGEFTVKRLQKKDGQVILQPENRAYKPIVITKEREFEVWGVVTYVIHQIRSNAL